MIFIFMLGLVGCSKIPGKNWRSSVPESHFGPHVETEAECKAYSGQWLLHGFSPYPRCIVPTNDGGKPCNDYIDCSGFCVTTRDEEPGAKAEGVCADDFTWVDSVQYIVKGRADNRLWE
jgi:hypothetical protein